MLYCCSASRPATEGETTVESKSVKTEKLTLSELDPLTIGVMNDMFTEKENDEYDGWHEVAGQADFDAF